jgi:hypothetical protein
MSNFEEFAGQRLDHRQRLDYNRQRLALKEQQEQRLTITYGGKQFHVTMELMSFLATWEDHTDLYLIDDYDNPVYIDSAKAMHERCRARWYEVMNDWHNQYQELKKVRRVGQLEPTDPVILNA